MDFQSIGLGGSVFNQKNKSVFLAQVSKISQLFLKK